MRRWLPIVLLLAAAGIVTLVLLWNSKHVEPLSLEAAGSQAHSSPAGVEDALQLDADTKRAAVTPQVESAATAKSDPSAAHLTVHVLAVSTRKPISAVRLTLTPTAGEAPAHGTRTSSGTRGDLETSPITDAEGVVHFELPFGRDLLIHARRDDQASGGGLFEAADGSTMRVGFDISRPLHFHVSGESGAGASSVQVPALRAGEQRELELVVEDELEGHVVGRVVCAETREPVAGARVRVLSGGQSRTEWHTPGPDERTTGNDGQFELAFSLTSAPRLCVEANGYGLRYANLDNLHADAAHALVVYVSRAASLCARVLDASGAPIPDAWIELSTRGFQLSYHEADERGFFSSGIPPSSPPDEHWHAQTGADGRAKIDGIAPSVEVTTKVVRAGQTLRNEPGGLTFEPGENREVEWRIGAGTVVHGLALDQDGKPVAGLEILAVIAALDGRRYPTGLAGHQVGAKATTDRDGRFTLRDLAPGEWSIGPARENDSLVAPIAELLESAGEPVLELTLRVWRGLFIRGRVLMPNGEGMPQCLVDGLLPPADSPEFAKTGRDGNFAFGPVGPGTFTLTAYAFTAFAASDPVQASAGDSGVVLQLKQGGSIRGRVVDGVTGAACTAQLVFAAEEPRPDNSANESMTSTRPDGSFAEAGLAPGRWSVTASTADGRFAQHARIDVGAGTDSGELVLALSPGGKLRLGYKGAQHWVSVSVKSQGAAVLMEARVEPGKFAEYMAPVGSLVLEFRESRTSPARTQTIELQAGETKEITLTDED